MKCPKCGFEQEDGLEECMRCGIVFKKYEEVMRKKQQFLSATYSPIPFREEKVSTPKIDISKEDVEFLKKFYDEFSNFVRNFKGGTTLLDAFSDSLKSQREKIGLLGDKLNKTIKQIEEFQKGIVEEIEKLKSEYFPNDNFQKISEVKENLLKVEEKLSEMSSFETLPFFDRINTIYEDFQKFKEKLSKESVGDVDVDSLRDEIKILQAEVQNLIENKGDTFNQSDFEGRLKFLEMKLDEKFNNFEEKVQILENKFNEFERKLNIASISVDEEKKKISEELKEAGKDAFHVNKEELELFKKEYEELKNDLNKIKSIFSEISDTLIKFKEGAGGDD